MEAAAGAALPAEQIKKAAQALLAYSKNKKKTTTDKLLLNEEENLFLMITVWKIPPREQVIKIPLPHPIQTAAAEVCLFTKDEPGLTAEQTENLYKKRLSQCGITSITEVISYKTLKKEYKPFEAKRRLLSRFALFLSDDRIRRLLPSHIGKHFYKSKKAPLAVNLKAKNLAKEINKYIQGTILPVTNKGCCYSARIGHTGMEAWKISENIIAAAAVIATKAPQIWKNVKILHLKTDRSVALPIFAWSHPKSHIVQKQTDIEIQDIQTPKKKEKNKPNKKVKMDSTTIDNANQALDATRPDVEKVDSFTVADSEEEDGEIPQLIPIEVSPSGKGGKVMQSSRALQRKIKPDTKQLTNPLGKRKIFSPSGTSAVQLEIPGDRSGLKTPKLIRKSKASNEKVSEKEQAKTPQKPVAKSLQTLKMGKAVKSSKNITKPLHKNRRKIKTP